MTTIVNTPPTASESSGSGMGMVIGLLLVVLLGFLFFWYGLPMIRRSVAPPQVNVPDQIDVNVNQGEGGQ